MFNQYDWSALNILDLSNNRLGLDGSCAVTNTSHFMDFLRPLWNLTDLYLDGNPIKDVLQPNMLLNQTKLQSLKLSQTLLTNLRLKMDHLVDLTLLDISHNDIQCLYTSAMRNINTIVYHNTRRGNVFKVLEMNLSHNPLRCTCFCLEFYMWMRKVRTHINFTDFNSYRCTFDNGREVSLSEVNLIVDILHSQCLSTGWSLVKRTTTTILILYSLIVAATTSFRFREMYPTMCLRFSHGL